MNKYVSAEGLYFKKGQAVRILLPGVLFGKKGVIDCAQSLKKFYKTTGYIPVADVPTVGTCSIEPKYLQILTLNKTKGGVMKMPRIIRFVLYVILVLSVWRFAYPVIDIILQFLSRLVSK